MELWGWLLLGAMALIIAGLLLRLALMRHALDEITAGLSARLSADTNTLLDVSSRDRHVRALAAALNAELRQLRAERRRFQQGDTELKEAVTNLSHDLRTPLTAVCGYLELLEREELSADARRYLTLISGRAEVLKQLTEELFRYSVLATVHDEATERLSLKGMLEESLAAAYGALTQRGITPEIRLCESGVERTLNRSALTRIFGNILSNALKYSDGDLTVTLTEEGTATFTNTARSLTPVLVGRLFDRFYTVETGRNATGLGLSIARLLTERMGGTIGAGYENERLSIVVSFRRQKVER